MFSLFFALFMKSCTLALFSHQRRNTVRTSTLTNDVGKGQEGGMVAKSSISIKSLVRFSIKLNSSFRQYWKMSWTFLKEIELSIFFCEEFKVEILPDIDVSFLRPNYCNSEYIF